MKVWQSLSLNVIFSYRISLMSLDLQVFTGILALELTQSILISTLSLCSNKTNRSQLIDLSFYRWGWGKNDWFSKDHLQPTFLDVEIIYRKRTSLKKHEGWAAITFFGKTSTSFFSILSFPSYTICNIQYTICNSRTYFPLPRLVFDGWRLLSEALFCNRTTCSLIIRLRLSQLFCPLFN